MPRSPKGGDTLNPIAILLNVGKAAGSTGGTASATKPLDDGALFKTQLDSSLLAASSAAAPATSTSTASASPDASSTLLDELVARIKSQLDGGASTGAVTAQLAGSLATQVAAMLGISTQAAHAQLAAAFGNALSTTGSGPPGTTDAQRASTLATRFRQVAELAAGVTNTQETGTAIRSIAGQRSDAATAKAPPTPTSSQTDEIVRGALGALAASASFVPGMASIASAAPSASAASAAVPAQGDGRTVALSPDASPIATGGATLLGRTLTRALLAGDQRSAPAAAAAGTSDDQQTGSAAPAPLPAAAQTSSGSGTNASATVDAYVRAFASALAQSEGGGSPGTNDGGTARDGGAAAFAPTPQHATAVDGSSLPQNTSFAIPVAHEAAPIAPPAPAPTLPQAQPVDANAVIDQLLRGMQVSTAEGTSTVRLRLVPDQLGDVNVKLVVSGGSVDATLTAHTADAQSALAGAQTQLAKSLADAGLKLQSFTVGLAGGGFAGTGDQTNRDASARQNSRKAGIAPVGETTDETDDSRALLAMPTFGPPLYTASPALGALNYLV